MRNVRHKHDVMLVYISNMISMSQQCFSLRFSYEQVFFPNQELKYESDGKDCDFEFKPNQSTRHKHVFQHTFHIYPYADDFVDYIHLQFF